MITIRTGDLTRLLANIIPFAFPDEDMPDLNVVRIEWDGEQLHLSATDSLRTARCSWHPDDEPTDPKQDALFTPYGGADDRWVVFARLDEAKALITHFKLPAKEAGVPLALDHDRGRLRVSRNIESGHEEIEVVVTTRFVEFPDLTKILDAEPPTGQVTAIRFVGRHLADFCAVRATGQFTLTFNGATGTTRVTIGDRFTGTIRPDRSGEQRQLTLTGTTAAVSG